MQSFLLWVRERCKSKDVATFACRPDNVEGYPTSSSQPGGDGVHVSGVRTKRTVDSMEWVPEVPDMIGIYHSFVRGGLAASMGYACII